MAKLFGVSMNSMYGSRSDGAERPVVNVASSTTGNGLKALRERQGWTLEQAAQAMGVSRGGYVKLERGERKLTQTYIENAVEVFGATAQDVLGPPLAALDGEPLGNRALRQARKVLPAFGASIGSGKNAIDVTFLERLAAATLEELGHPEAQSRDLAAAWIKTARRPTEPAPDDAQVRLLAQSLIRLFRS